MQVADYFGVLEPPGERRDRKQRLHQEVALVALALLQVFGPAHGTDARDAVPQRDEPDPAMLEPVDADVALVTSGPPLDTPEVRKEGRTLVMPALALQAQLIADQRVAPGSVDKVARLAAERLAGVGAALDHHRVRASPE